MPSNTPAKTHAALMKPIVKEFISGLVGARHFLNSVMQSTDVRFGSSNSVDVNQEAGSDSNQRRRWSTNGWQIRIKKAEGMRRLDYTHPFRAMLLQSIFVSQQIPTDPLL